jgi:hypothetical protein
VQGERGEPFPVKLIRIKDKKAQITDEAAAFSLVNEIRSKPFIVSSINKEGVAK